MRKEKLTAVFVVIVTIFIVFALGLFIGRKLSSTGSKEGIINESMLQNVTNAGLLNKRNKRSPSKKFANVVPSGKIKLSPLSKPAPVKNAKNIPKLAARSPIISTSKFKSKPKAVLKAKKNHIKKPVYAYKYAKSKTASSISSPFSSKFYYTIQVAALTRVKDANMMASKLNSIGFFAYVLPIVIFGSHGKVTYQQIRVGKFSSLNGAKSVEKIIAKKLHVKPYIIKVD